MLQTIAFLLVAAGAYVGVKALYAAKPQPPFAPPAPAAAPDAPQTYTLGSSENGNPGLLASKLGVDLVDLQKANPGVRAFKPGDTVKLPPRKG